MPTVNQALDLPRFEALTHVVYLATAVSIEGLAFPYDHVGRCELFNREMTERGIAVTLSKQGAGWVLAGDSAVVATLLKGIADPDGMRAALRQIQKATATPFPVDGTARYAAPAFDLGTSGTARSAGVPSVGGSYNAPAFGAAGRGSAPATGAGGTETIAGTTYDVAKIAGALTPPEVFLLSSATTAEATKVEIVLAAARRAGIAVPPVASADLASAVIRRRSQTR